MPHRPILEKVMSQAAEQLGAFSRAGGQVLFGTDVGYIDQFDTSDEFKWMSRAGMSFRDILASLTTNPAQRFGYAAHSGRIAKGLDAELVVLERRPGSGRARRFQRFATRSEAGRSFTRRSEILKT